MSGFVRGKVAPERSSSLTTATHQELKTKYGCVAQLVAQLTLNQLVVGSSPTTPNFKEKLGFSLVFLFVDFPLSNGSVFFWAVCVVRIVCKKSAKVPYNLYFTPRKYCENRFRKLLEKWLFLLFLFPIVFMFKSSHSLYCAVYLYCTDSLRKTV